MRIKKRVSRRSLFKISSFLLAVTFWFYVLNSETLEVERKVNLVLLPPKGLAVSSKTPEKIRVKFKGSRILIKELFANKNKNMFVELDNFDYKREVFPLSFRPSMIPVPFGMEVLEFTPSQVMISLDREIKKMVPVRSKLLGKLPKNLKLIKKEIEPEQFMIKGPRSVLKKIGQLETSAIDLSLLEGEGVSRVALEIDPRVTVEDYRDVSFSYAVRPSEANMSFKNVRISFLTPHNRFYSKIKWASLDVLINQNIADTSDRKTLKEKLKVVAQIPSGIKGKIKVKLAAELPEGMHLLRLEPEYVNILIR